VTLNTMKIGTTTLTRLGYVDVTVPAEVVSVTAAHIRATEWAEPYWAEGDLARAAAAAWLIESGDARIVVDPALAADDILRNGADASTHQEAFAAMFADAGVPREEVTHAIATHIDGIGMFAWRNDDGSWSPFFPNAPLMISQRELDAFANGHLASGQQVLAELRAQGVVEPVSADVMRVTDDVAIEFTGAHSPGHQIVRVGAGADSAVVIGHLAVSPLGLTAGNRPGAHIDSVRAWEILEELRDSGAVLVGPLWPAPGAGRWEQGRFVALPM
jgi:glyoxylase-like metal-dependent hydrolase (beta-lactamase superfamily II)